jgi:hypothetical protein
LPLLARRSPVHLLLAIVILAGILPGGIVHAQAVLPVPSGHFGSSPRSWSVFTEYSPNSSHIFLGDTNQREFITLGASFTQRLFRNRIWALDYRAEIRPLMVESDPAINQLTFHVTGQDDEVDNLPRKYPVLNPINPLLMYQIYVPYSATPLTVVETGRYTRRWTYVGGLSPAGLQARFLPHSRIQPVLTLMTGFTVSPRDIPTFDSSAFNFTFSFGAGIDFFRTSTRAVRLEYRLHHLSNAGTGATNPGIDSQMIHLGYSWGR